MPGTVLLLAASPAGKGCLVDAASVLPVLAAVAPPVLAGTETANVVELADPLDPQAVLTRLRAAAGTPGPLTVFLTGQLQLDRRQHLPHLALARTTAATVRYTGLPWHWLREELRLRPPGTTTLFADLHADAETWQRLRSLTLDAGPAVAVLGRVAPPPPRRTVAQPLYMKTVATILRSGHRPPPAELHQQVLARIASKDPGSYGDVVLSSEAMAPAGGVGVFGGTVPVGVARGFPPAGVAPGSPPAGVPHGATAPPPVPASAPPVPASAPPVPAPASPPPPPSYGPSNPLPGDPAGPSGRSSQVRPVRPVRPPVVTTPGSGEAVKSVLGAAGAVGAVVEPSAGKVAEPIAGQASGPGAVDAFAWASDGDTYLVPGQIIDVDQSRAAGPEPDRAAEIPPDDDPHAAITAAVQAERHDEADGLAARCEQDARQSHGPASEEALHWSEVRADLAMFAGDAVRSCRTWLTVATARMGAGQAPDAPAVETAVDRAHHQWSQVEDGTQARDLGAALLGLRQQVPGRRAGALRHVQRRLTALEIETQVLGTAEQAPGVFTGTGSGS
ncbi:hypothetical protein [Streptomyces sp. CRN 30]|uniref:hypothetical protein n=1 Tax=Streptomyces sp. CRN 30 TaxID=3075613 RepID=UPI002A83BD28|nr:hypothetical protein [Streptomyces sp. CRN 30]